MLEFSTRCYSCSQKLRGAQCWSCKAMGLQCVICHVAVRGKNHLESGRSTERPPPSPSPSPRTAASPPYLLISWLNCRVQNFLACENIRFSSLFAAGDVTSPAAKSEEKRMFSQAKNFLGEFRISKIHT